MNETWLAHHGVKGRKWGVRRFQNEDGSLTAAGRKRVTQDEAKAAKKAGVYDYRTEANRAIRDREVGKKVSERLLEKYGKENMDALKKNDY